MNGNDGNRSTWPPNRVNELFFTEPLPEPVGPEPASAYEAENWLGEYWCGCGYPEEAFEVFRDYLAVFKIRSGCAAYRRFIDLDASAAFEARHGKGVACLLGYLIHGAGLATHSGSVVSSAYLTPLGDAVVDLIEANPERLTR